MAHSEERLNLIYDKTDGYCHLCWKKLAFSNYGRVGRRGAWEVEHSRPRSKGGTDHLNNLFPACISCNRDKKDGSTRTSRARNGQTRAPRSKAVKEQVQTRNTIGGAIIGGLAGGPIGLLLGAWIGHEQDPQ